MKKIIYLIAMTLGLFATTTGSAQMKAVERSAKKTPVWVGGAETDYIVTSAIRGDLEAAKAQCLDDVRTQIIRAVAENVKSSSSSTISQEVSGDEIVSFLDSFSSNTQTQAASVPFVTGVSASKIADYYWEKRQDKKTGQTEYLYSIKYPFPSVQLKQLVRAFEKYDREMMDKYKALEAGLEDVESVEQIDRAIVALNPLIAYFFDDARKSAAVSLQGAYKKLYENITFRPSGSKLGEYSFYLVLDGRPIMTSQRPTVKSEIATELTIAAQDDESYRVTYAYDLAEYGVENAVTVTFRLGGRSVPHTFFFTIKKHEVSLWPEKTVYLTAREKAEGTLTDIELRMNMRNGYKSDFLIRSVTLNVPGLAQPLFFDNLDIEYPAGRTETTLQVVWPGTVQVLTPQNNRQGIVRGHIEFAVFGHDGELMQERLDFSLPMQPNW